MTTAPPFSTPTMAQILMDQGRYAEAARIYRSLLDQHPRRPDLAEALDKALALAQDQRRRLLVGLFGRWFDLMADYNRLRRLNRLGRSGSGTRGRGDTEIE